MATESTRELVRSKGRREARLDQGAAYGSAKFTHAAREGLADPRKVKDSNRTVQSRFKVTPV